MENEIVKPMSIERAEFIATLADLIKNTKLPPFVIEPIFKDILSDIRILSQRQLESDMRQYKESLSKKENEGNE